MQAIETAIQNNMYLAWLTLIISFGVLAKCADIFVDASVGLAKKFRIPRLVIGIVLVSLATTAPELGVSLTAALDGKPEMALGNAIGSVICDDGLALALAGVFSAAPIAVMPAVLKTSGIFLVFIEILAFLFVAWDYSLQRHEGTVLVALFISYMYLLFRLHKKGRLKDDLVIDNCPPAASMHLPKLILLFVISLAGIAFASEYIVTSATTIALSFRIPESVLSLTLVALGTSIPEVATCITAARKNEGAVAVGNIIGADIMNICWVAGASSLANDLTVGKKEIYFMFPSMFVIVGTMLILLRIGYSLTRTKGIILFGLYCIYIASFFLLFPPC
ncbi:MAG: calcium/sodium antiporter [Chitinivibrionales bacterium]|nr:calcium/sodium antiporter [Chitinivibrionales bacterium]